jgi:hydroxymethylpyrimidine/phosphomethylpyrimidine kinase
MAGRKIIVTARVLIIAGSDSSGGAGIQADLKTVMALGGYGMSAITALTAQNTMGVTAVHIPPANFLRQQIEACLEDIGVDVIKIGMIGSIENAEVIMDVLQNNPLIPVVLDPVMVATSGAALGSDDVVKFIKQTLMPLASVITPNIPEAEILLGHKIITIEDQRAAACDLRNSGSGAVLVKGGHGKGKTVTDILCDQDDRHVFENPRIETLSTHGTGCTLASGVATGMAQDMPLRKACKRAIIYVHQAIKTAPGLGKGHGPLNHAVTEK